MNNMNSMNNKFQSLEQDNERQSQPSQQSATTPASVANSWNMVAEMKENAMDEAFGMASKDGVTRDSDKAHSQFRNYNWA